MKLKYGVRREMTTWACLHREGIKNQQINEDKEMFARGRAHYLSENLSDYLLQLNTRKKIIDKVHGSSK